MAEETEKGAEKSKSAQSKDNITLQTYLQMKPVTLRRAFEIWLQEKSKTIQKGTKEQFDELFKQFMNAAA
jgi:hypothetical protein